MSDRSHPRSDPAAETRRTFEDTGWQETTGQTPVRVREPGTTIAGYVILEQLGAGGMGVVYTAYDPKLDRKVALKVLRTDCEADRIVARQRLLDEGRALARVNHPNVVAVHDVGTFEDEVYIAMELVEGRTLGEWRREVTRSWSDIVRLFLEVASGLSAVHDAGLVHRDVKPDNILVDGSGRARVTDFGLARPQGPDLRPLAEAELALVGAVSTPSSPRVDLTQTGARLGTPAYMSSEQLQGLPATDKSDQFGFCVALWETLYQERPFEGQNWYSLIIAVGKGQIREPTPKPGTRSIPSWLRRIIERGLNPDPALRWPSMEALGAALAAGDPHRRRRRWWAVGGAVTALAMLGAGTTAAARARTRQAIEACEAQSARIDDIWSSNARTQLESSFAASGVADANSIASGVVQELDRFATKWSALRSETCAAASVEQTMEPELSSRAFDCFEQQLSGFEAMVRTFATADEVVVTRAKRSVEGLGDLESCQDEADLRRAPDLPTDPDVRTEVRRLLQELTATQVHEHVGRYDQGLESSRGALDRALKTGHLPVIAVARYRVAVFLEKKGRYDEAVEQWAEAFRRATLAGDEQLAAQAASALAFCEGYQLGRYDAGIRWAELSGVYLERLGLTQTLTEATRLDVLAVLLEMKGRYEESIATHERALEIRRSVAGPEHYSVAYGMANLAGVLEATGQLERARETLVAARAIFEAEFGPDNPTTAHVLHNLANLHVELGEYEPAEALLERVRRTWIETLGPTHPDVGDVDNALAGLRRRQGRFEDAVSLHHRALEVHRASLPIDHPTLGHTAVALAQALVLVGESEDARRHFELAAELFERAGKERRDELGRALHGLATLDLASGAYERARRRFERSEAAFEEHAGSHQAWRARCRLGSAATFMAQGEPERGRAALEELARDEGLDLATRARAHAWLARATSTRETLEHHRARAEDLASRAGAESRHEVATLLRELDR